MRERVQKGWQDTKSKEGKEEALAGLAVWSSGLRSQLFAPADLSSGMGKQQQEGKKEVHGKNGAQTKATAVKERCKDKGKGKNEKEFLVTKKGTQCAATSGGKVAGGKTRCTDANGEGKKREPKEKEICVICQEVKRCAMP